MELLIKNMVSRRCKKLVQEEMDKMGLYYNSIDLGMIEIPGEIEPHLRSQLKINLLALGLELMDDKRSLLVNNAENIIIEMIYFSTTFHEGNLPDYICKKLKCDCIYLSNIFAELKGVSLQKYIIINKIMKVKELLIYNELSLTEIAFKLQYSSVSHLSNQFKKLTGLSPSAFLKLYRQNIKNLDKVGNLQHSLTIV